MNKKPIIITHSGSFHIDELFAVTILDILLNGGYELIRTRDPEIIKTGDYVIDVGKIYNPEKNLFDHHQKGGGGVRKNGIPYSSFGLVWKHYGEEISKSKKVANLIDERLCWSIDAADNGVETFEQINKNLFPYLMHSLNAAFRSTWKEKDRSDDDAFKEVLQFIKKVLKREIIHAHDDIEGWKIVEKIYTDTKDKRIIVLEDIYPADEILSKKPEPLYIVKPDKQNGGRWRVKTVRTGHMGFEDRKSLPFSWAGKFGKELADITGVHDAEFCHNGRFIAVAGSKEGALKLAQIAADA